VGGVEADGGGNGMLIRYLGDVMMYIMTVDDADTLAMMGRDS
jgi:hypothetical protein